MSTTTILDSVTTEDARPTVAPHRISNVAGYNTATVKFTATHNGDLLPGPTTYPSPGSIAPANSSLALGPFPDDPAFYPDDGAAINGVAQDIIGYVVREGGVDQTTGKAVEFAGSVCSAALPCSARRKCSEWGFRVPSGTQQTVVIPYADANDGAGDGAKNVTIYALTENQGWS